MVLYMLSTFSDGKKNELKLKKMRVLLGEKNL